jgi:epoxide hydrolase-like predicted phosphatase
MKAVVFDLGNVLVRYDRAANIAALAAVSQADGAAISTLLDEVGGLLTVGEMSGDHLHQLLIERAGTTSSPTDFAIAASAGITPDEEALTYALTLQAQPDVTVAVISNTIDLHVNWLDANVPQLAEIDLVMMSNEVHLAKPDPAIYQLALELLALPPEAAIMVDDLAENVTSAQAVGLFGIVHTDWAVTRTQLEAWLSA